MNNPPNTFEQSAMPADSQRQSEKQNQSEQQDKDGAPGFRGDENGREHQKVILADLGTY
jgi:hypothetical protein